MSNLHHLLEENNMTLVSTAVITETSTAKGIIERFKVPSQSFLASIYQFETKVVERMTF